MQELRLSPKESFSWSLPVVAQDAASSPVCFLLRDSHTLWSRFPAGSHSNRFGNSTCAVLQPPNVNKWLVCNSSNQIFFLFFNYTYLTDIDKFLLLRDETYPISILNSYFSSTELPSCFDTLEQIGTKLSRLLPQSMHKSLEPTFFPKLQVHFADFPYSTFST
jgi:hypothetical protein